MNRSTFILLPVLLLTLFVLTPSCKSDDPPVEVPTCTDGIMNQEEEDVDCGGPCPPCEVMGMSASISGYSWVAQNISASYSGGKLTITADNNVTPLWQIVLVHDGPATPGTYSLSTQSSLAQMGNPYTFQSGSITITKFDTQNKVVSGTFTMTCQSTYNVKVEQGNFTILPYN
ncbi:MAG TPA: DUF6252 family protein [Bacteroidales bacterium]|nr:DUF6252 family protein [Bacteroidales bacterium]HRZ77297.1 DUF6252 family protein [Bacteroidales bacterium]